MIARAASTILVLTLVTIGIAYQVVDGRESQNIDVSHDGPLVAVWSGQNPTILTLSNISNTSLTEIRTESHTVTPRASTPVETPVATRVSRCEQLAHSTLVPGESVSYPCLAEAPIRVSARQGDAQTITRPQPPAPLWLSMRGPNQPVTGETVDYVVSIDNTGVTAIPRLTVRSITTPECGRDIAALPAGKHTEYVCTAKAPSGDSIQTVTGQTGSAIALAAPLFVDIATPKVLLLPEAKGDVTSLRIANIGDVEFTTVKIVGEDPAVPPCDREQLPRLVPGTSASFRCANSGKLTVHAESAVGPVTAATDLANAAGTGGLHVTHQLSQRTVIRGGSVTYTMTISNTGPEPLSNVVVDANPLPGCAAQQVGDLAPGQQASINCTLVASDVDTTIAALVTATTLPTGDQGSRDVAELSTSLRLDVIAPAIQATITPSENGVLVSITNTGDIGVTDLVIDTGDPTCVPPTGSKVSLGVPPIEFTCPNVEYVWAQATAPGAHPVVAFALPPAAPQ